MISDIQIQIVLDMIRAQEAAGKPHNFATIQGTIFKKYHETYNLRMLKRLYAAEKDNPKFKPREIPTPYIDLKTGKD